MGLPPSPNLATVYRWEQHSSLEHACWACPTKSNSPKALHSCYGVHSMPCLAYHPTMHAIGAIHHCTACITSREAHESRHREIAGLVADYQTAAAYEQGAVSPKLTLQERPVNVPARFEFRGHHNNNNHNDYENDEIEQDQDHTDNEDDETVSMAETISIPTDGENTNTNSKLTKAEQRQRKKAAKAEKSQRKAAKSQAKHCVQVVSEDVQKVGEILHGEQADARLDTHPLPTDKTIEDVIARNLGFVKQIQSHKQALINAVSQGRKEDKERRRNKRRMSEGLLEDTETEAAIDAILDRLGIDKKIIADTAPPPPHLGSHVNNSTTGNSTSWASASNNHRMKRSKSVYKTPSKPRSAVPVLSCPLSDHTKTAKTQTAIVHKLRAAVKDDLEKHENDLRLTYIRAGGFFRYAGKHIFDRLAEIAARLDLQTGEEWEKKLKRASLSDVAAADADTGDEANVDAGNEANAAADAMIDGNL